MSKLFTTLPVTSHTDYVTAGSTFVAIPGSKLNGIDFIPEALKKGAKKIVVHNDAIINSEIQKEIDKYKPEIIKVNDCRQAISELSAQAWNYPVKKLNIIGVTGTKGKTTTTFLLHHLFKLSGYRTAMISGVKNIILDKEYDAQLTTPLPDYLHAFFAKCVKERVQFVVMETSAQAFSLKRLYDIKFNGAIFTNLDPEHFEFYNDMNEYFLAKCEIFKQLKINAPVIVNCDNEWGKKASIECNYPSKCLSFTNELSDYFAKIIKNNLNGLEIEINNKKFNAPNLIGSFNAYNIAAVIALAMEMDIPYSKIFKAIQTFTGTPGRMQRVMLSNGAMAVIDYAHNPSSFEQVLPTLKNLTDNLIVVFGCGGDRDKTKRPVMGKIAASIADKVIITSDNPRSEDAQIIINEILLGIPEYNKSKVTTEIDRKKAIEIAYSFSKSGSIIAILGKGPDEYQIIGDHKTYFSDKLTIEQVSGVTTCAK